MQTTSTQDGTNQELLKSEDTSSTEKMQFNIDTMKKFFSDNIAKMSAETVGWLAIVLMHCATVPSILSLIFGVSDRLPSLDVVGFIWLGLILFFFRALISKDMLNIITIGVGFIIQAGLLGFLVFK